MRRPTSRVKTLGTSDPRLNTEDFALANKQLRQIQRANRDPNHTVDIRPVNHRREDRIRAHVLLCWPPPLLIHVGKHDGHKTWH